MKEQQLKSPSQLNDTNKVCEYTVDELFMNNIFIVDGIIKKLYYNNYLKDDLRQVGLLGLYRAASKFKSSYNVKFSTYASYFVLGEIKRELRNNKNIKIGKKIIKIITLLNEGKEINDLTNLGYSKDEIFLGLEYKDMQYMKYETIDKEEFNENINKYSLDEISYILKGDMFSIIKYKYFLNYSQKEIGELLNYSQSKISRLEEIAKTILKKFYN